MSYFYCESLEENSLVTLNREESLHLSKILRAKEGDVISLLNGFGKTAEAVIISADPKKTICRTTAICHHEDPKIKIHLYLAPPRHNILSPLIKQCVELGVWQIHLLDCEYSVAKPKEKENIFSSEIIAAAKQSGNPFFPEIIPLQKFPHALKSCPLPKIYGATPEENVLLLNEIPQGEMSLWIGPEGGFSATELTLLKDAGAKAITIGNWILRVETALVGLMAVLQCRNKF